jgi:hypothetical protein
MRPGLPPGEYHPVAPSRHLLLDLDPESDPIVGALSNERGARYAFTGWLGFASALEKAMGPEPVDPIENLRAGPSCDAPRGGHTVARWRQPD